MPIPNATVEIHRYHDDWYYLDAPSIGGSFVIGKTLTANKGRWNKRGGSVFTYEWPRAGAVVATGASYTLTAADAGEGIAIRVTNSNLMDYDDLRVVSATTSAKVAMYASTVGAKVKKLKKGKKSGASQVTVSVKAGAQAAPGSPAPSGSPRARRGSPRSR